jgi:hypothetical protein
MKISKLNKSKKINRIIIPIVFLILVIFILLESTGSTRILSSLTGSNPVNTTDPSQSDFTGEKEKEVLYNNKEEGVVSDTKGKVDTTPAEDEWITSADKKISVYSPTANSILSSGSILSGQSTANIISFRLIDNISGVIAQGKISVVSGKFSGVFNFKTAATEGRLDVFFANDNGSESSIIEIPVRFNQ